MKISDVVSAATNTFSLPQVCTKLREVLDDPRSEFSDLAKVIATDPILSAKLLRLANSAFFRFSQQVETVQKAVSIMGGEAVYDLAIAEAMSCAKNQFQSNLLDTNQLWLDSLFRGVLAKEIAKSKRVRGAERFFVLGIMSRLSEMVIAAHFESTYERYVNQKKLSLPWHAQRAELGFTFANANGAICEVWGLPPKICRPISTIFSVQHKHLDNDAKTLQLAIKMTFHHYKDPRFLDVSSLEPELSLWPKSEDELKEVIESSYNEAKTLQSFF